MQKFKGMQEEGAEVGPARGVGSLKKGEPELEGKRPEVGGSDPHIKVPFYGRGWFTSLIGSLAAVGGALALLDGALSYVGAGILVVLGPALGWLGIARDKKQFQRLVFALLEAFTRLLDAMTDFVKNRNGKK